MSDDRDVSRRYRELEREEPPRALDDAILAASRRSAQTRPAPLVVPSGRRRWYFPLAAAAIIVLAVAVTIHVEREQPDAEFVVQTEPAPKAAMRERAKQPQAPEFVPDPKPRPAKPPPAPESPASVLSDSKSAERRDAAPVAPPPADAVAAARESGRAAAERSGDQERLEERAAMARQAPAPAAQAMRRAPESAREEIAQLSSLAKASPDQWLLAIDDLKRQGRHDEAEKQLAEFRKRHPNYRIPEAITEKFEKR